MKDEDFFNEINDDISVVEGNKKELIVFTNSKDMLSFLELLQMNKKVNNRTLITLNSGSNSKKFLNRYQNYDGKMFLCLTGDRTGNAITMKILTEFNGKNIKDVRPLYEISENGNQDLSEYLDNKLNRQDKNTNLVEPKISENESNAIESGRTSDSQQVGNGTPEQHTGELGSKNQSEQIGSYGSGQSLGSNNAGNGLAGTERSNLGNRDRERGSDGGTQSKNAQKNEGREHSLGGIISGRPVSDRRRSEGRFSEVSENSTNYVELDALISRYKDRKLNNEQVAELVSAACFVSDDHKIFLKENLNITDNLKVICNQFQSGGTSKEGRGILDEYYTQDKIVDAVRNLIKDHFKTQKEISILEPSIGTGNFIYATHRLSVNSKITGFEINETTAKIAKILHPEADINLRSFETEFIDDRGNRKDSKDFSEKYDLVIGNPPYGEHRGLYKGLGEEPKISKYEDYFVKRSLDSLKPNGVLAMVLPSSWLNRRSNLKNANILEGFRLPNGAFAGTQIGTDIIILRKNTQNISTDISNYFDDNPARILGETREKTNRFGRLEKYIRGNLDEALFKIDQFKNRIETQRIGNLFEDLFLEEEAKVENKVSVPKKGNTEIEDSTRIENQNENEVNVIETQEKIELVLSKFNNIKFKSPTITNEISKYEKLREDLITKPTSFSEEKLKELIEKSDRIISIHNTRAEKEYQLQTKPEIKKGVLKYQFSKQDKIVNTSLQNSSEITKEQIEAFRDTSYDGTLNNRGKHYQFANFIDGKWVHDFYYTEGNIYAKMEQLERDFCRSSASNFLINNKIGAGTAGQYEKQKALLENVLPKAKSLDEIYISPNHEFVHKFELGQIEKDQYNHITKRTESVIVDYNLAEKFKDFVGTLSSEAFAGSSAWEVRSFVDNETVTGSDKERNALVRERRKAAANDLFYKFVREELSNDIRNRFVKDFNRNYNNIHVPDYSKFPLFSRIYLHFKGQELRLTEVQKAGIGRQTTKGVGLLAHEVGFGKTLSGILSMHEAMERGNAKRPIIVVPNDSILKQWVETIFETIPNAKVNVLGNLGKDFDLSKFDNKDGEITIVTYEGFNNIGFSSEITEELSSKFSYISTSEM
ncbi:N-6 DNA methylase, partial [Epilithonimonas hispanica]